MSRGRPREFDTESALDAALAVFSRVGYGQASVQELAEAMGICKPSLYAAYGNKEALFIEAIRRYAARGEAHHRAILERHDVAFDAIAALLEDTVQGFTSCGASSGCMIISEAASAQAAYSARVRDEISAVMTSASALVLGRLQRALAEADLPAGTDVDALSGYLSTVLAGLSVQARNGAAAPALRAIIRTAMQAWPVHSPASRASTAA